jgi:hypothetical protein
MPHLCRMYAKLLGGFDYRLNPSDRFKRDLGFELTADILAIFSLITCSLLLQVTILTYCPDYGVQYTAYRAAWEDEISCRVQPSCVNPLCAAPDIRPVSHRERRSF